MGLTHLNIRQSIAILLFRLILIDLLMAGFIIGFYSILARVDLTDLVYLSPTETFFYVFGLLGFTKILVTIWVVLKWLYEYYEITPEYIIHKRGLIFRRTEQYRIDHVRMIDIQDTLLGELFNFSTVTLYDLRLNKYLDLYLIHNPQRYALVIKSLKPDIEVKDDKTILPFIPKREEISVYTDD